MTLLPWVPLLGEMELSTGVAAAGAVMVTVAEAETVVATVLVA